MFYPKRQVQSKTGSCMDAKFRPNNVPSWASEAASVVAMAVFPVPFPSCKPVLGSAADLQSALGCPGVGTPTFSYLGSLGWRFP
jgi:hypothetical protein